MAEPTIRLDKSRPISECRGERAPDDPHYRVTSFQPYKVGKNTIMLPFDSDGVLVADDGKTEPFVGLVEGKPVTHHPLYTPAMRDLVARLKASLAKGKSAEPEIDPVSAVDGDGETSDPAEEVNFVAWLRGEATYEWSALQVAAKKRFSRVFQRKQQMVEDLVLDEGLVTEDQVCDALRKLLPAKAAA